MIPARVAVALTAAALAVAGCGLGEGKSQGGGAELRVTRDFGQKPLGDTARRADVKQSDTVMRFLQSERKVTLRYGGNFVQSIDGLSGRGATGRDDWFFFVNGEESDSGAGDRKLNPGDVVQWDYRDWIATMHIPAIVGAYPEPFLHGLRGKRAPVRVECSDASSDACKQVKERLGEAGVTASGGALGTASRGEVLRLFVGKWSDLRGIHSLRTLEKGPAASGVFARFGDDGARLDLLDARGGVAQTAGPGTGLVAATKLNQEENVSWIVTGVDDAGTSAAAKLLDQNSLRDAFAVAALPGGAPRKLPFGEGGGG
jgi:hypothetical protein